MGCIKLKVGSSKYWTHKMGTNLVVRRNKPSELKVRHTEFEPYVGSMSIHKSYILFRKVAKKKHKHI